MDSTGIVRNLVFDVDFDSPSILDWAYLEDWCRKLTNNFEDVYVFTVPLYLPRLEADGKWRVVRISMSFSSTASC